MGSEYDTCTMLVAQSARKLIIEIVSVMFLKRVVEWDYLLKVVQINPFQKKGDKQDPHNYRGVCLLAMGSRILAQIIAVRLTNWAEDLEPMDENQNGLRTGRSAADATQVFIRIEEDVQYLRKKRNHQGLEAQTTNDPEARLLDLTKAYPRVNKPALWEIIRRYGMKGAFLDTHSLPGHPQPLSSGDARRTAMSGPPEEA